MSERELFVAALHLTDPVARAAFLDQACGADRPLLDRVQSLLIEHGKMGSFLEAPAAAPPAAGTRAFGPPADATHTYGSPSAEPTVDHLSKDEHAGAVIAGKYTLVEPIGEGGMGSVWRAKQTEPVKRFVAVKLIKAGMDSKQVLARFEAERQALALMDHPNIAKVLDGGLHDHRPFFVMELVKGVPITEYCDRHKLTPPQRLELFVQVCQAIQHAHQKGVIHRDIKPSNVLIALYDDRPVVKVIDFGVAKATGAALTERTIDTGFGGVIGTPQYMSPEQATFNNLDIDTRSDVYALGVLLYELLAGSPPFARKDLEKRGLLEILRVVREEEPPRPSTKLSAADALPTLSADRGTEPKKLTGLLRNELDWVVMKALEKDRARRYETANAFAADVQRYLSGEAVQAHPPSAAYRLKKFVRRNKGQVIAVSLVLLALLGGIAGTTTGLIEAKRQEEEAKRQEKLARDESGEKEKARADEVERVKERDAALRAEGERADELKHRLGVSAMVLANAAYDNRDFKLAAERLDAVPVGQRGWEWRYLKRQLNGGIFTLRGHKSAVTSVAFSPDGTRIVTGAGGQNEPFEVKVWDARTGLPLFDLKGLPATVPGGNVPVVCVAFSADNKRIVTAGGDKTTRVWDAATGAIRLELNEPAALEGVSCAAFSPDGTQIVTAFRAGSAGVMKVWDAQTGKHLLDWKAHRYAVSRISFSPDGTRILTGGADQAVKVWDAKTGEVRLDAKGMMSEESSVAFSPDGTRIVAGREDGTARVIDPRTGGVLLVLRGRPRVSNAFSLSTTGVLSVAFSPDGTRIATAGTTGGFGTGEASVWDARTGAELLELKGHTGMVMSASFSPDGERIITGSADGTAKVWDARTGTPRLELNGIKAPILSHTMSADGQWIVTGTAQAEFEPGKATIWDARTGVAKHVLTGFKGPVHSVAISRDGTRIVAGGGNAGEEGSLPTGPDGTPLIDPNSPGIRKTFAEAVVWDAQTRQPLVELKGLKEVVTSVAISPDGTRIVTGGGEAMHNQGNEVKLWDARTGSLLLDLTKGTSAGGFRPGARVSVAFSSDGTKFVVAGARSTTSMGEGVTIRNARTGAAEVELKESKGVVLSVVFSADGTRIATASFENTATIWDAATGAALVELKGHTGNVNTVAFSPDGKRILTGSGDRTVRVWDARTGTTLAELRAHAGAVTSVSFTADGSQILTTGRGAVGKPGEVFVWDARASKDPPDEEEYAYRRLHTQSNPLRYRGGYLAARMGKDEFAAAFYLNLVPAGERKELLHQGDADASAARNVLAQEHIRVGKLDEAIPLLVEILSINKAKRGSEDPETVRVMDDLGRLYHQTGQFEKAIPLLADVVKVRKAKQDPQTLNAMGMLGVAYKDANRLKEAIAVLEEGAPKDHWVRQQLLDVYALAGENDKVVRVCREQLNQLQKEKDEGAVTESKADLLARLGRAYLAQKSWAEAETHLRECVTIRVKNWPDQWPTFETQSLLGEALLRQKKYADAEPLLLKGYEGLKQRENSLEPRDEPRVPEAVDRLIELYTTTNKPDEAKKWQAERAKYPMPKELAPPPREKK